MQSLCSPPDVEFVARPRRVASAADRCSMECSRTRVTRPGKCRRARPHEPSVPPRPGRSSRIRGPRRRGSLIAQGGCEPSRRERFWCCLRRRWPVSKRAVHSLTVVGAVEILPPERFAGGAPWQSESSAESVSHRSHLAWAGWSSRGGCRRPARMVPMWPSSESTGRSTRSAPAFCPGRLARQRTTERCSSSWSSTRPGGAWTPRATWCRTSSAPACR